MGAYKPHLKVLLDLGGAYKPQTLLVNLLIRLTTIELFNTSVCHHQKGEIVGTKCVKQYHFLSFEDNKVLKYVNWIC